MIVLVVYWLFSLLSGIDFDIDVDIDADIDLDADSGHEIVDFEDPNLQLDGEDIVNKKQRQLKWWQIFLVFFNFVGLPFMFTFTVFILVWWLLAISITGYTNTYNLGVGHWIVLACIVPALFGAKYIGQPFKPFFRILNKDGDNPIDFLGREGISLSSISGEKMGNGEVLIDGNHYSIYIKSDSGEKIEYRDSILIIREAKDRSYYFVQTYKH